MRLHCHKAAVCEVLTGEVAVNSLAGIEFRYDAPNGRSRAPDRDDQEGTQKPGADLPRRGPRPAAVRGQRQAPACFRPVFHRPPDTTGRPARSYPGRVGAHGLGGRSPAESIDGGTGRGAYCRQFAAARGGLRFESLDAAAHRIGLPPQRSAMSEAPAAPGSPRTHRPAPGQSHPGDGDPRLRLAAERTDPKVLSRAGTGRFSQRQRLRGTGRGDGFRQCHAGRIQPGAGPGRASLAAEEIRRTARGLPRAAVRSEARRWTADGHARMGAQRFSPSAPL